MLREPLKLNGIRPGDTIAATGMAVGVFFTCLIFLLSLIGGFSPAADGLIVTDIQARLGASALAALVAGVAIFQMRQSGWSLPLAALVIALFGSTAHILYAVTAQIDYLPLIVSLAGIVSAVKVLRETGDVQAQIRLGLALSLLPFGGALAMPILPVLALYGALLEPEARRRPMVLFALVLVLVIPALIVATGIAIFAVRSGAPIVPFFSMSYWQVLSPKLPTGALVHPMRDYIAALPVVAFMLLLTLSNREGGRQSGFVAMLLLPAYLEFGRLKLGWDIPFWISTAVFFAGALALMAQCRVRSSLQLLACCVAAGLAYLSWNVAGPSQDWVWRTSVERPIRLLGS